MRERGCARVRVRADDDGRAFFTRGAYRFLDDCDAGRAAKGPGEVSVVSGSIDRVPCWDFLSLSPPLSPALPRFFHLAGAAMPPRNARPHIETWDRAGASLKSVRIHLPRPCL